MSLIKLHKQSVIFLFFVFSATLLSSQSNQPEVNKPGLVGMVDNKISDPDLVQEEQAYQKYYGVPNQDLPKPINENNENITTSQLHNQLNKPGITNPFEATTQIMTTEQGHSEFPEKTAPVQPEKRSATIPQNPRAQNLSERLKGAEEPKFNASPEVRGRMEEKFPKPMSNFAQEGERARQEFTQSDAFQHDAFERPVGPTEGVSAPGNVEATVESQESHLETIETADQGNWVLKRVWWEQAEETFEKIIQLNDQIVQSQINLVTNRNDFDKKIDLLFNKVGIEQSDIESVISYLLELQSQETDSETLKEELDVINKVNSKKEELDKIKNDLSEMGKQDNLISESLIQLMHLVNECRQYERKSWDNFKEIGRVLSDETAKTLYYQIEANYKNVDSINEYINGKLGDFIHKTLNSLNQLSEQIISLITQLDEQGFNLKDLKQKHEEAIEKKKRIQELKDQEAASPKKKVSTGFFASIGGWFISLWKSIKGLFGFK